MNTNEKTAGEVGLTDEQRESVRTAIAEALGDAYDCTRVWSAWSYGTMGPDDFVLVAEDDDRLSEIADAAIGAIAREALATRAPADLSGLTEKKIAATAREQADREADECGVNRDDYWKLYGDNLVADLCSIIEKLGLATTSTAAVGESVKVPEGFALVPLEPNEGMKSAIWSMRASNTADSFATCYRAMLAAATVPPVSAAEEPTGELPIVLTDTEIIAVLRKEFDLPADYLRAGKAGRMPETRLGTGWRARWAMPSTTCHRPGTYPMNGNRAPASWSANGTFPVPKLMMGRERIDPRHCPDWFGRGKRLCRRSPSPPQASRRAQVQLSRCRR
jgi:hypothetical protein